MRPRRLVLRAVLLAGLVAGALQPASAGVARVQVDYTQGALMFGNTAGSSFALVFLFRTDLLFGSLPITNRVFDGGLGADQTFASVPGVVDANPPDLFGCIFIGGGRSSDFGCEILPPATIEVCLASVAAVCAPGMVKGTVNFAVASSIYPGDLTAILLLEETDDETDGPDLNPNTNVGHATKTSPSGLPYEARLAATGTLERPARVTYGAVRSHWLGIGGEVKQHFALLAQALARRDPSGLGWSGGATALVNLDRLICDPSFSETVDRLEQLEQSLGRDLPWESDCLVRRL